MLHVFRLLKTQRWGFRLFTVLSALNVVLLSSVIPTHGQQACTLTLPDAQPNPSSPPYTALGGNPFDPKYWGNCTWYAWGRVNEVSSEFKLPKKLGNARSWVDEIKLPHDNQPAGQSLAVWDDGEFGHVAYVEAVDVGQKTICFSEANVKTFKEANGDRGGGYDGMIKQMSVEQFENRNLSAHRKYVFRGYIHLPAAINTGVAPWDTPPSTSSSSGAGNISRAIPVPIVGGWTSAGHEVENGQWTGQPDNAPSRGKYFPNYYAIDTDPSVSSYWLFNGSGFGATPGHVSFSDPQISVVSIAAWTDSQIKVVLTVPFSFTTNPDVTVTIVTADRASVSFAVKVISTIRTRGYGQCTWYVANQRLTQGLSIPQPAYATTATIGSDYIPHQWDVIDFGKRHTAIITSPVTFQETAKSDGSKTLSYSFLIGEMNADWKENASSVQSKFVVGVKADGKRAVLEGIKSRLTTTATDYFSSVPNSVEAEVQNPPQPSAAGSSSMQQTEPDQPESAVRNQPPQVLSAQPITSNPGEAPGAQQTLPEATAPAQQYQPQNPAPVQSFVNPDGNSSAQQTLPATAAPPVQDQPQPTSPAQPSVANPNGTPSGQQMIQPPGPIAGTPATTLTLNSISPASHAVGQFTVDVYGSGFQQGAKVFAQGQGWSSDRPPVTVIDSTHLQAVIVAKNAASFTIAVRNPDGRLSGTLPMQITAPATPTANLTSSPAAPVLQSLNPTTHAVGQFTVDVYGSGFQQGAKVFAQGQGWSSDRPPVTVIDSTHLQAVIDAKNPASFSLAVRNPDGSLSRSLPVQITASAVLTANATSSGTAPILQSVSPTIHAAGQFQVDLYGSGFQQGAKVIAQGTDWNSDQASVMYLAPNHLRAIIAASNPSRFTLTVRNPDGQLSGPQPFEVTLVPSTTPGKPAQSNQRPGSVQPIPNQPTTSVDSHTGPTAQPNTGQPVSSGITSPLPKVGGQPTSSLPNSSPNAGNPHTSSTTVPNRPPGTPQSSAPGQKPLPSQEPMRPIQVQTVPSSHPGSTISTTTSVPKINVPSKTAPATQTNPVVQQTTNNSGTQKSTNLQVKTTVPTSYPISTAATGQNNVSKPIIQPKTPSSSPTSSTAHTTTSPTVHPPSTANSAATNQKPVPVTTTPPRGVAATTTTYRQPTTPPPQTQQRTQQTPSNQKTSTQPTNNTSQSTTQKPGDKKK